MPMTVPQAETTDRDDQSTTSESNSLSPFILSSVRPGDLELRGCNSLSDNTLHSGYEMQEVDCRWMWALSLQDITVTPSGVSVTCLLQHSLLLREQDSFAHRHCSPTLLIDRWTGHTPCASYHGCPYRTAQVYLLVQSTAHSCGSLIHRIVHPLGADSVPQSNPAYVAFIGCRFRISHNRARLRRSIRAKFIGKCAASNLQYSSAKSQGVSELSLCVPSNASYQNVMQRCTACNTVLWWRRLCIHNASGSSVCWNRFLVLSCLRFTFGYSRLGTGFCLWMSQ